MKNLIVAFTFAMLSLTLPLTMAQQVADIESVVEVESNSETSIENDGKRIVIDIKTADLDDASDDLRAVMEAVTEIFGEEIGAELHSELLGLDDDDRNELHQGFKKIFHSKSNYSGNSFGSGFFDFLVPLFAIVLIFGMPVIILSLILIYRNKKRKQKLDLIGGYLKAEQTVPEHLTAEFGSDSNVKSLFRSGVTLSLVGVAISIFFLSVGGVEVAAIGLIPIAIGVSRLISWKYDNGKDSA